MDEYAPEMIPMSSASAKFRMEYPPKEYSARRVKTTVTPVMRDRTMVCMIEKLMTGLSGSPGFSFRFSRIRSKTTIVSWTEKPITVSTAVTNRLSTSTWKK